MDFVKRNVRYLFRVRYRYDAWSDFDLGYMNACKGFGLFTATWVVVGVATSLSVPPLGSSYPRLTSRPLPQDLLVKIFLYLSSCFTKWSDGQIFTHDFENLIIILPALETCVMEVGT